MNWFLLPMTRATLHKITWFWTAKEKGLEQKQRKSHWIAHENVTQLNLRIEDKAKLHEMKEHTSLGCVIL